jgi:hypothetical protein
MLALARVLRWFEGPSGRCRYEASVIITVGPCSRCGDGKDRLICGLPAD